MDTGIKISVSAHAVLLVFAAFGGQLFKADEPVSVQISEVSLLTSEEFAALQVPAPNAADITPTQPVPEQQPDQVAILDAPKPPSRPERLQPPKAPEVSEAPEPAIPELEPLTEPPTPASAAEDQAGEVKPEPPKPDETPAPSPRVADENTPAPATDAEVAKVTENASAESLDAAEPVEKVTEKAPKQSSTEIVTEAEKPKETTAPTKSVRPRPRPRDLAARQVEPEPTPEPEPEPQEVETGPSIDDLMAAAVAEDANNPSASPDGSGQALTESEQKGLVLAVEQCWSVPVGIQNAADLVVVLSVDLARNGGLKSSPKMIEPGSSDGQIKQAFEAARRALIACAPYDLPIEKYDSWKTLEVVFNPKNMVLK